jgi:hypothetical protein
MTADYQISCTSSKYFFGFVWSLCMILVYPIGCPALYFYLLWTHRREITSRDPNPSLGGNEMTPDELAIYPLRLLFHSYRPHLWWWEMVETANRLLLTGVLVLVAQGSALQIVIGLLLSLLFIRLYDSFDPFDDHVVSAVKNLSQWQIFFVFFIALLFKADFSSIDSEALVGCLVFIIFANLLLDCLKLISTLWRTNPRMSIGTERRPGDSLEMRPSCTVDPTPPSTPLHSSLQRGREVSKSSELSLERSIGRETELTNTSSPLYGDKLLV